jgi:hypothetical protein
MRPAASALVLVVAVALAGCGGSSGGGSSSAPASTSAPSSTSATATSGRTTTRASNPGSGRSKPAAGSAPTTPAATVRAALTSSSPNEVCALYAPKLLDRSYGGAGGCRSAVGSGGTASSVKIVSAQPGKVGYVVVAVPHGGPSSGEKLTISLTPQGGGWQLDSISSNVKVGP